MKSLNFITHSLLVLFLASFLFTQIGLKAMADPLSASELKALNEYPNWVSSGGTAATTCPNDGADSNGPVDLTGATMALQIMNFLVQHGLSPTQAAGIAGNISLESSYQPELLQNTHGVTPAETLSSSQLSDHNLGWGLVQWTPPGKLINEFTPASGANDPGAQINFLWGQLTDTGADAEDPQILKDIKAVGDGDLRNAVLAFQGNQQVGGQYYGYERPQDENGSVDRRLQGAQVAFQAYSNGGSPAGGTGGGQTISTITCDGAGGGTDTVITGNGSGKFTTNSSAAAYPGLDAMLAYAKKVAQTAAGPLPADTQAFCSLLPGGTCAFGCESSVEEVWLKHRGEYPNPYPQPPNASSAWAVINAAGHAHPGDRNPPVGALLFYTDIGDANGHVAVYLGNNLVFSTDVLGSGSVYIASADKIESAGWNMTYVGWGDPYFSGKVGNP